MIEEFSYSEFRSKAGDVSVALVSNQDACSDAPTSLRLRYQSGIQTRDFLVDHQIFLFCGGGKTLIIQTRRSNTRSKRCYTEGFTLRYRGLAHSVAMPYHFVDLTTRSVSSASASPRITLGEASACRRMREREQRLL